MIAPEAVVTFERLDGFRVVKSFGLTRGEAVCARSLLRSTFRSIGAFIGLAPIDYLTDGSTRVIAFGEAVLLEPQPGVLR